MNIKKIPTFQNKPKSLRRMLFAYMFVLALLLLILMLIGIFLIGGFINPKHRMFTTLDFQADVFERQIDMFYDNLAVMSIQLSEDATDTLENYLEENELAFEQLNGSETHIENLQEELIQHLLKKLWETDCTGTFVILDAQVNTEVKNAENSRTGLYLQRNSLSANDTQVLLYRGLSAVGKRHDCITHRKWTLEFDTSKVPNYDEQLQNAALPLKSAYRITDVATLTGTDQRVMLMTIPLLGKDGSCYGLCGFEINEKYFLQTFEQPSNLSRLIFCLTSNSNGLRTAEDSLCTGILNDYYLEPTGTFEVEPFGGGLAKYTSKYNSYVGITKEISLCPCSNTSSISVLMPKSDFDQFANKDYLHMVILIVLFMLFACGLSITFADRYFAPFQMILEQIRRKEYQNVPIATPEINDLFAYLAEQDQKNEDALNKALQEKSNAIAAMKQTKEQYKEATRQIELLSPKGEYIDPYDYDTFINGLETLTKRERETFDLYISGKSVKEIVALLGVKESTVRYYNKTIYSKLGVHSLKQLLRYAARMNEELDSDK